VGVTFYLDLIQVSAPPIVPETGDFNADGVVNAADYTAWRKIVGVAPTEHNYNVWRTNFGHTLVSGGGAFSLPEPTGILALGMVGLGAISFGSSVRRSSTAPDRKACVIR
jgi:hypothetical protein